MFAGKLTLNSYRDHAILLRKKRGQMRSLYINKKLHFRPNTPEPVPLPDEALIRTRLVGICNTDMEILRGYKNFIGIPGHEFVGEVVQSDDAPELIGQRVVGEINLNCRHCPTCLRGNPTNCPNRTTLGIDRRDGAMADYVTLPVHLLHPVPDSISDTQAVFVELLAAACEIAEQVHIRPTDRVIVLGDGKLGLLVGQVIQLTGCDLTVVGRHSDKLDILARRGIRTQFDGEAITPDADIVVEATGSATGFATARSLVRPRGKLVLKSTFHGDVTLDLSRVVVDEIAIIGSRCGPFKPALRLLQQKMIDVESLIQATYSIDNGLEAFQEAGSKGSLKILLST